MAKKDVKTPYWLGKKRPEMGAFMSKVNTGRRHTNETKKKISEAMSIRKLSDETKEKLSIAKIGNKNPNWIEDRTKLSKNDRRDKGTYYASQVWSKSVKDRDGWKCQMADNNCTNKLESHHILPWSEFPELRYELKNGITLCTYHHPRKKLEVENLSPYFNNIVMSKYE